MNADLPFSSRALALLLVGAAIVVAPPARAQKSADQKAAAEALFRDGRKLFQANKFAEACPKFEESYRLDPSPGTQVNLATCHEKEGKLATAWSEFKDVLARATLDNRPEREKTARERIAAIEPKLGKLVIDIAPSNVVPGLTVTRSGVSVTSAALGTPLPVDAGTYAVQVTAPGYKPWDTKVEVSNGKETRVAIPALVKVPVDVPPPVAKVQEEPKEAPPPPPPSNKRTIGFIAAGVGVVGLGVGTVFGVRTLSKKSASDDNCVGGCTAKGAQLMDEAYSASTISNIGLGVGLVGVGVGTYLILTSNSAKEAGEPAAKAPAWRVAPSLGKDGGGVAVGGAFLCGREIVGWPRAAACCSQGARSSRVSRSGRPSRSKSPRGEAVARRALERAGPRATRARPPGPRRQGRQGQRAAPVGWLAAEVRPEQLEREREESRGQRAPAGVAFWSRAGCPSVRWVARSPAGARSSASSPSASFSAPEMSN